MGSLKDNDRQRMQDDDGYISLSELLFKTFGWAMIVMYVCGAYYVLFLREEPERRTRNPGTYSEYKVFYEGGEIEDAYIGGDPYRGSAY